MTDQAEKAIESAIKDALLSLNDSRFGNAPIDRNTLKILVDALLDARTDMATQEVEIAALQRTIRSITKQFNELESRSHTAPRDLVEALRQYVGDDLIVYRHGVESCKSQYHMRSEAYSDLVDALRSALSAQEPKVCEWVDDDPFWIISCQKVGLSHSCHEPVIVRKWKACPYCTNPIEVKESDVRQGGRG